MERTNHEATNAGTDNSISGFTATQKESDAPNHGRDVRMKLFTSKTDMELMVHQCETEKLISVPVQYVAVEVEQ